MSAPIILMRHGVTKFNLQGLVTGRRNEPLSDEGRSQAARAGGLLVRLPIARVWSSPLKRAAETACITTVAHAAPLYLYRELEERCWGIWEGRPRSERPIDCAEPTGGESITVFRTRVDAIFAEAEAAAPLLIVTHSGVLRRIFENAGCAFGSGLDHCIPIIMRRGADGAWQTLPLPPGNRAIADAAGR